MSDIENLVALCKEGDERAFEQLIVRYQNRIFDLTFTILRDEAEAKDATQDTFLRVYRRIGSFEGRSAFETWLIAIATNICRDRLRRRKVRAALSLEQLTPRWLRRLSRAEDEPPQQYARRRREERVWTAVDELEERLRLPLILRYRYDLSCGEIGEVLGIATTTVYGRLSEGRKRLGAMLQENDQGARFLVGETVW